MSIEWPTRSERRKNIRVYRLALAASKCMFTQDELDSYRNMMALPPSERLRRAVMMMLPRNSRMTRRRRTR
jgi:hypothetical protein